MFDLTAVNTKIIAYQRGCNKPNIKMPIGFSHSTGGVQQINWCTVLVDKNVLLRKSYTLQMHDAHPHPTPPHPHRPQPLEHEIDQT